MKFDNTDIDVMARTLWAEARGESHDGQVAVAWVILNRANRPAFAHELSGGVGSIARVCKAAWQFSCWNYNDPNRPFIDPQTDKERLKALKEEDYATQYDLCQDVIEGIVSDNTLGADMYYAPQGMGGVVPDWAAKCKQTAIIGRQIFFDSRRKPNDVVARAQVVLADAGFYTGKIDNDAGPATRAAVKLYQTSHGLAADGVLGLKTLTSMGVL